MGESAVLAHSYSFAAPITRNDSHEDHTNHALSQSISFGKFMTENLEWGKWSTFSHKKYVEEAEKYSRPGSVAQKKAFFEAHYKRIAEAKKAATEEQPTVTPAEVLLHTLETQPPLSLVPEEEPITERKSIQNDDDVLVVAMDDSLEVVKENSLKESECDDKEKGQDEEEKTRKSMTKNRPVFRLSLDKTIPPPKSVDTTRTEIASSEKTSERPITLSSGKTAEKPVHRKKFRLLNCFRANAKTRNHNQNREEGKRETKKQKKQFLCLCFKPKTVRACLLRPPIERERQVAVSLPPRDQSVEPSSFHLQDQSFEPSPFRLREPPRRRESPLNRLSIAPEERHRKRKKERKKKRKKKSVPQSLF